MTAGRITKASPRGRVTEALMKHVLLVEPDDDLCLFLRLAIGHVGCRISVTGSMEEARDVLGGGEAVDVVVTAAVLPDGSGVRLARDAVEAGKQVFVLRASRGRIEVCDRRGLVFRGNQLAVGDFLKKAISRGSDGKAADRKTGPLGPAAPRPSPAPTPGSARGSG
jgi:CheY-like chemotaxis protein